MSEAVKSDSESLITEEEGLSRETAFDVLSARRRRDVLHYLFQKERPVELRELSRRIAAWENDITEETVNYKQRMRVYTALRQSHLPKMDDHGIVNFDPNRGVIELTDDAPELEVYLEIVPHNEMPWSKYYALLGVFCGGLVMAAGIDLIPFNLLPDLAWAAVITLLFTGSALVHWQRNKRMRLGSPGEPPREEGD